MVAATGGLTAQVGRYGLSVGGHPALSLHSSSEPGELSQWPRHDDSTIMSSWLVLLGRIVVLHTQMWPIVTNRVAWSVDLSVGLTVTLVSPTKTAESIEIPCGLWVQMGPRNHVLDGSPETLKDVAMATNFGMQFATTGFMAFDGL